MSLLNIELTLILQFCFLDDLLKLFFVLDASIFTTIYEKKEEQKSTLQIFLKDVTEEKNLKTHKQLTMLPSKQNYRLSKTYKKSHSITRAIIALNKFTFHPNNY